MGKHKIPNEIQDPIMREAGWLVETVGDFISTMAQHVTPPTPPFNHEDLNECFLHMCQHYGALMQELERSSIEREFNIGEVKIVSADNLIDAIREILDGIGKKE